MLIIGLLLAAGNPVMAQSADKIHLFVDARSEGQGSRDESATRLLAAVRGGLEAVRDVDMVPRDLAQRIIWLIAGRTPGTYAASVMVTERYDRETLMVRHEDDDLAGRMMALQIVNDHQIFTGRDLQALAKRIVTSIDDGVLAKLRTTMQKR
jgi:hypothetical protein